LVANHSVLSDAPDYAVSHPLLFRECGRLEASVYGKFGVVLSRGSKPLLAFFGLLPGALYLFEIAFKVTVELPERYFFGLAYGGTVQALLNALFYYDCCVAVGFQSHICYTFFAVLNVSGM
jgi:hypothetical protein